MLHGSKVSFRGLVLTNLFFADDSLIFFRPFVEQATSLKGILASYGKVSGQMISFLKSSITFSKNTPP